MAPSIVGTLPVKQSIDPNGSLSLDIALQIPPAKVAPKLSLAYHSASHAASTVGLGWVLRGASIIERVPATLAQDGYRGVVNYDKNDRFALDGQRLVHVGGNEYRYEIEQWSKFVVAGDAANPTSWTEYLPDGSVCTFGNTVDSNIKAVGQSATRVWAVSQVSDAFSNYMTYSYNNDTSTGSFYVTQIAYGGNRTLNMAHQRKITLEYVARSDVFTKYIGGSMITIDKHLSSVSSLVNNSLVHKHVLIYDAAPLTGASRLSQLTLVDASGASVRPLKFDWVDGNPSVFEEPGADSALNFVGAEVNMMPMDVHATGRSDVVIASKVTVGNVAKTRIATHLSDGSGTLSIQPSSVFDTLPYHVALFPLDVNGNGQTDLVHISLANTTFTLTVLLSTANGFVAQTSKTFHPESSGGFFRSGDFEGNGRVGLVYIYQSNGTNVKFVQFVSDGHNFTPLAAASGPTAIAFKDMKAVVGDLNGNGAEDVFLLSPKTENKNKYCFISLLESQGGVLKYKPDVALGAVGKNVPWTATTTFLPYSLDEDSKTSILVASKLVGKGVLVLNILRSNGRTLLPSPQAFETSILYDGDLTIARASSTNSLDLINTFQMTTAKPPRTNITVLRYNNGTFKALDSVRQGPSFASSTWGDFRGVGRSDLLLNTKVQGRFNIKPMRCASQQPVDFISGYTTGMGARVDVAYAPLSDRTTYDADSSVSNFPLAATNAMARNVSSSADLSTSSVSHSSHSRSEIVYFPSWVVKQTVSTPYSLRPDVKEQTEYTYRNARFSFDGRGWLGFGTVTKVSEVQEATWYNQAFPFLGQVDRTETRTKGGEMLQTREYGWRDVHFVAMTSLSEVYYEGGVRAYSVNATYDHDGYGNITGLSIVSPEVGTPALTITSTFDNVPWVIGNKTSEVVTQSGQVLKQTRISYFSGSHTAKETKSWVKGDEWSIQTVKVDEAGNQVDVRGPGQAHREFVFDETKSHVASAKTYVSDSAPPLVESIVFSLEHGKPLSFADANGDGKSYTYDVLGRLQDTYQQETLIKTESFVFDDDSGPQHVSKSRTEWGKDVWFRTVDYVDGVNRVWRTERPRPDSAEALIFCDTVFDGAGRMVSHSRDFLEGDNPVFTTYEYDARSRIVKETAPPPSSGLFSTVTTRQYSFASGLAECTERRVAGDDVKTKSTQTQYLPKADKPSVDHLVKPYVVASSDELGQRVERSFDGLGRLVLVKDPSDVRLNLSWDGLSRLVERRLSQPELGGDRRDLSHSLVVYDDDVSQKSLQNVLTGSTTVTTFDFSKRPIAMTSPDESNLTYVYDDGGQYSKGRLVSVTSESTGLVYTYDYDIHGHLVTNKLSIDGQTFTTSYTWSPLKQLLSVVNPDGTAFNRVLCGDGESVSRMELTDAKKAVKATIALGRYEDVFGRPLLCDFGNGISSVSSVHDSGVLSGITMSKGGHAVHCQEWDIDSFNQISGYQRDHGGDQSGSVLFSYDISGQLKDVTAKDPASLKEKYTYDASGNLAGIQGKTFDNDGWQLSRVKNLSKTESTFTYSDDGNMLSKKDSAGRAIRTMKYDSHGQLVELDGLRMVYDYGGRLVKRVQSNGDTTLYPTQSYELDIASGKKTHTSYLVHGYRRASLSQKEGETGVVHYYHNDHLGSTVAVSDAQGELVAQYKYNAFGQVTVDGSDIARYKFSGKELIGGLYYFGARFYDPEIGRFLTLDNYTLNLDDLSPCTFNMYAFSRNNPVNFIDVNGNAPWWHWLADAFLITLGAGLMFVPVVGWAAVAAMGITTGAVLGAGISGLNADMAGGSADSDGEWGFQLSLGALIGGIGGGGGAAFDLAVPAASWSTRAVGKFITRTTTRAIFKAGLSTGVNIVQTMADNAAHGRALDDQLAAAIPFADGMQSGTEISLQIGLAFVSDRFKEHLKTGKYRLVGKQGSFRRTMARVRLDMRDVPADYALPTYPPAETGLGLDVAYNHGTESVRLLSMIETTL